MNSGSVTKLPTAEATTYIYSHHDKALPPVVDLISGWSVIRVFAFELSESGKSNRVIIPARALSRPIRTGLSIEPWLFNIQTPDTMLSRGLITVGPYFGAPAGELRLILHNPGHEMAAVMHGEWIATLIPVLAGSVRRR